MRYSVVNGHNVGAQARGSNSPFITPFEQRDKLQESVKLLFQVWRQRCFILIEQQNFDFFEANFAGDMSSDQTLCVEGHTLQDKTDLNALPAKDWFPGSKPALHKWLCFEQSEVDAKRLKTLGNVVMPHVCRFALQILGWQARC